MPLHCTSMGKLLLERPAAPAPGCVDRGLDALPLHRKHHHRSSGLATGTRRDPQARLLGGQPGVPRGRGLPCRSGERQERARCVPPLPSPRRRRACRRLKRLRTCLRSRGGGRSWRAQVGQRLSARPSRDRHMGLGYDQISEILKIIDSSSCEEFVLEIWGHQARASSSQRSTGPRRPRSPRCPCRAHIAGDDAAPANPRQPRAST